MKSAIFLVASSQFLVPVLSQVGAWGQCGGQGWTGGKSCISGYTCTYSNDFYSQCLPGGGSQPTTTKAAPTTTKAAPTTVKTTASTQPTTGSPSTGWIVPGAVWKDTSGAKIDAHGGSMLKEGNTFYWCGQSYGSAIAPRIYASTDLINWKNMGLANSVPLMFRPKLFKLGSKFWIYGQISRSVTSLFSDSITGKTYSKGPIMTLPPSAYKYTDAGIFQDTDGKWYFITSADHNTLQINLVNSDGTVGARMSKMGGELEAPDIFKAGSVYFLITSGKTGYRANPCKMYWSTSLSGPWSGPSDIAPPAENTYGSQNTHELVVKGSAATTYIYMGDAWDKKGSAASNYMWLPMIVSESARTVKLDYHAYWRVDINTGRVTTSTTGKRYEAEYASISGRAAITGCDHCISKRAVHKLDRESEITFSNVTGSGAAQWVSLHYSANNHTAGDAHVYVNDSPIPHKVSEHHSSAGQRKTTPIRIHLEKGHNTIRIGVTGAEDFELHFDGIEVIDD